MGAQARASGLGQLQPISEKTGTNGTCEAQSRGFKNVVNQLMTLMKKGYFVALGGLALFLGIFWALFISGPALQYVTYYPLGTIVIIVLVVGLLLAVVLLLKDVDKKAKQESENNDQFLPTQGTV